MIAAVSETDTRRDEREPVRLITDPHLWPAAFQQACSATASGYKKRFPGLNHSSLTVASRSTIAPPRMDFTPPLCFKQNREGRQGLRGELKDL